MGNIISIVLLSLLAAFVVGLLCFLGYGVFRARSLFRRELSAYFTSPIGFMTFAVFLAGTGFLFLQPLNLLTTTGPEGVEYPMRNMFGAAFFQSESPSWGMFGRLIFWAVFPLIPALLTMRLFAEEQSSGTLEMLMTAPVREWQVVLAKYLACFTFYLLLWLPTLLYLPVLLNLDVSWGATVKAQGFQAAVWTQPATLVMLGGGLMVLIGLIMLFPRLGTVPRIISLILLVKGTVLAILGASAHASQEGPTVLNITAGIDLAPVWTTYLGMILIGAMFLAIGLLASSLVKQQLVAALIAMGLSLLFILGVAIQPLLTPGDFFERLVYFFSVPSHFQQTFTRGLLDTRHLILYASVALFCLFLTVRSIERRRWA